MSDNDDYPECWTTTCEAENGASGITICIHCGAELIEVDGWWYHWTSFDNEGKLVEGAQAQDYVKPIKNEV